MKSKHKAGGHKHQTRAPRTLTNRGKRHHMKKGGKK